MATGILKKKEPQEKFWSVGEKDLRYISSKGFVNFLHDFARKTDQRTFRLGSMREAMRFYAGLNENVKQKFRNGLTRLESKKSNKNAIVDTKITIWEKKDPHLQPSAELKSGRQLLTFDNSNSNVYMCVAKEHPSFEEFLDHFRQQKSADKAPEKSADKDKVPEKSLDKAKIQEKVSSKEKVPVKSPAEDKVLDKASGKAKVPKKTSAKVPEKSSNKSKVPEKSSFKAKIPKKSPAKDTVPEKSPAKDTVPEKSSAKGKVPQKRVDKEKVPEKSSTKAIQKSVRWYDRYNEYDKVGKFSKNR